MAEIDGESFVFERAFDHFDACITELGETVARGARVGIAHGGDDPRRLRICDRVGARGAAPDMSARFESDVEHGAFRSLASLLQCHSLGMGRPPGAV